MKQYQKDLIRLLISTRALSFGDFTLKSGRKSPYFINTGKFSNGSALGELGRIYAQHLVDNGLNQVDFLFGPAYKGIPLAAATSIALASHHKQTMEFIFDRKESKDHGEGGLLVGGPLKDGQSLVIIEDVITAGTTINATMTLLAGIARVQIRAVVVLVDRCERGKDGTRSAVAEVEASYGLKVAPVVTVYDILNYLSSDESGDLKLDFSMQDRMRGYLAEYAPRGDGQGQTL